MQTTTEEKKKKEGEKENRTEHEKGEIRRLDKDCQKEEGTFRRSQLTNELHQGIGPRLPTKT